MIELYPGFPALHLTDVQLRPCTPLGVEVMSNVTHLSGELSFHHENPYLYSLETEGKGRGDFLFHSHYETHGPSPAPHVLSKIRDQMSMAIPHVALGQFPQFREESILSEHRFFTIFMHLKKGQPTDLPRSLFSKCEDIEPVCQVCIEQPGHNHTFLNPYRGGGHPTGESPIHCLDIIMELESIKNTVPKNVEIFGMVETVQRVIYRNGFIHLEKGFVDRCGVSPIREVWSCFSTYFNHERQNLEQVDIGNLILQI